MLASQKWWFSLALLGAPARGMQRGKLLLLSSRKRESLYRAHFAHLSKVVVFCGTFGCTSKGYVERETSLALLKREGVREGNFSCFAQERGSQFTGLTMLASQKWWFSVALLGAPVRGM